MVRNQSETGQTQPLSLFLSPLPIPSPDGAASAKRCFLECQKESQNYGRDVETEVSGRLGLQCLTLLSGMSRKKPKLRWEWKNTGFETPHPHAAEGRGGPAGWGCQCLTLLSGISRLE